MSQTNFVVDKEKLEVRISREFKASPERLWKAFSDPKEIAQWWNNTDIETHDFRVGGKWRFVEKDPEEAGNEHAFRGEFKEIDEPRKIVRTFEYEPWAGHILIETVEIKPQGEGKTLVTTTSKYDNLQDLEGMVQSGMERGATAGFERIAKLVEEN